MTRSDLKYVQLIKSADQPSFTVLRKDLSGGQNTRQHPNNLAENQAVLLQNADIGIPGMSRKRPGETLLEDLSDTSGRSLFAFQPDGGTNDLISITVSGTDICKYWPSTGSFVSLGSLTDGSIDTTLVPTFCKVFKSGGDGDVAIYSDGHSNLREIKQNHTVTTLTDSGNTNPPKGSNVMGFYGGRLWILRDNQLFFSSAYPSDYSTAFDQSTNAFNVPVGHERFIIPVRDTGIICGGKDCIYGVTPSTTPAATDKVEKLLDIGCEAVRSACLVGDDVLFLAKDGVRSLQRSVNDKLQQQDSRPLSYALKTEFESINWAYIYKASAVYFDNKYFISLPTSSSTYNNQVWVYYPGTNGWTIITGWTVQDWAVLKVNGQPRLYAIGQDSKVYRAWYGSTDNGANITYKEHGRQEDLGEPMKEKEGGEVYVKIKGTALVDVPVYVSFDDGGANLLGYISTEDRTVPFLNYTFPMEFKDSGVYVKKFHIDEYGKWTQAQIKIEHVGQAGDDLTILERGINTFVDEYLAETF